MPNLKEYMYHGVQTLNADVSESFLTSKWHSITRMSNLWFKIALLYHPRKMASKVNSESSGGKWCFSRSIKYLFWNERLKISGIYLAHIWWGETVWSVEIIIFIKKSSVLTVDQISQSPSLVLALEDSDIFIKQFKKQKYIQL